MIEIPGPDDPPTNPRPVPATRKASPATVLPAALTAALLLVLVALLHPEAIRAQDVAWHEPRDAGEVERMCGVQVVSQEELEEAIRAQWAYDITATPNQGRFFAELLLDLAEVREGEHPDGPPFVVRQEEFFPAFLEVTGLSPEEVPVSFRKSRDFGQRMIVEYRRERVMDRIREGPEPRRALAVRAVWPDTGDVPSSYTYEDTLSDPEVRVRHERDITYRLLEFDDMVVYDEMGGVSGRPTTGALGALFDILGMARVVESRFAVSEFEVQVTRSRVRMLISRTAVATVEPDGVARRGMPDGSPELERLAARLERDLEIEYAAVPPPPCPGPRGPPG